jgi:hypothetical protein
MNCTHCDRPLNEGQFHGNLKSCPRCSTRNGQEHVFYPFPDAFGITEKRASGKRPDGPQSYCVPCRGGSDIPNFTPILCSQK